MRINGKIRAAVILAAAAAVAAGGFFALHKSEPDKVTLQLLWVAQAQFAGYYAAKDKGFYEDLNLDVTINPAGPGVSAPQIMRSGGADVAVLWMSTALAEREKGLRLVNIAQPFKRAGIVLACRRDTGVETPADLPGRTVGVWFHGKEYPFLNWMAQLNMTHLLNFTDERLPGRINVIEQGYEIDAVLDGRADCVSAMTYNEIGRLADAGMIGENLTVFSYEDEGVALLEDGLYVLEERLSDPAFADKMARFVKASMKGWAYARGNPRDAAEIVLKNGAAAREDQGRHQLRMAVQIVKLTDSSGGRLDPEDYERTVRLLMSAGESSPAITKEPEGAWTHAVVDKSENL